MGPLAAKYLVAEAWRCLGPARYDVCALWGIFKRQTWRAALRLGDGVAVTGGDRDEGGNGGGTGEAGQLAEVEPVRGEFLTAFFNQTQHFGKGMRAAPAAKLNDGLLDAVYIRSSLRSFTLRTFLQLPKGTHIASTPGLVARQVRSVELEPELEHGVLNIDGELVPYDIRAAGDSIVLECVPQCLHIFCDLPPPQQQQPGEVV